MSEPASSSARPAWRRLALPVLGLAIAALIAVAFRRALLEVLASVARVDPLWLTAALLLCIAYRVLNSSGWVFVLRALEQPMPLARGMRLWILSESARWVPGSIWGFCSRVYQATQHGVPASVASASLPLELLLTIAAWALTALGGLWLSGSTVDWASLVSPRLLAFAAGGVLLVGSVLVLCAWRLPEGKIGRKLTRLRAQLSELRTLPIRPGTLAGVLGLYTVLCTLHGLAFSLVIRAVSDTPVDLLAVIGINAFGWLAGFFAVGAPGGIGVREAGAAFLLSAILPLPVAAAASVLWRLVMMVDEILCLSACLAPRALAPWQRPAGALARPS